MPTEAESIDHLKEYSRRMYEGVRAVQRDGDDKDVANMQLHLLRECAISLAIIANSTRQEWLPILPVDVTKDGEDDNT